MSGKLLVVERGVDKLGREALCSMKKDTNLCGNLFVFVKCVECSVVCGVDLFFTFLATAFVCCSQRQGIEDLEAQQQQKKP